MIDVSIIVAVFNEEKYLARCLQSLASQTFTGKYEVVVVDDGSTDGTADIIQKFRDAYPDIFISVKQKNLGQGMARNNGISIAKGSYIGFTDADDWVEANYLSELFDSITKYQSDISVCDVHKIFVEEKAEADIRSMKCDDGLIDIAAYITEGQSNSYSWNKLYRREIWQTNKFPKMVYEDLDILIPIMSRCKKISYVHQALYYYYYKHSDSTTSAYTNPRLFQIFKAYEDLIANSTDRYKLEAQFCAVKRILINMNTVGFNYYLSYFILLLRKINNLNNDNYLINNNERTKDIQYYSNREVLPQNIFIPESANLKAWNYYKFDEKIMPYSDDLRATIDKLFAEGGLLILGKLNPQAPIGYLRSLNDFILLDTNGQILIIGLSAKHPLANLLVNNYDNKESPSEYFDKILADKASYNRLLNEVTVININALDNKVLFARY